MNERPREAWLTNEMSKGIIQGVYIKPIGKGQLGSKSQLFKTLNPTPDLKGVKNQNR